jgi:hypothetical protein
VDAGGRRVDVEDRGCRQRRQRKLQLGRRKPEAL